MNLGNIKLNELISEWYNLISNNPSWSLIVAIALVVLVYFLRNKRSIY